MYDLKAFYGPNAGYVLELYERYRQNPASVDAASRAIFDTRSPIDQLTAEQEAIPEIAPIEVSKIVAASASVIGLCRACQSSSNCQSTPSTERARCR